MMQPGLALQILSLFFPLKFAELCVETITLANIVE